LSSSRRDSIGQLKKDYKSTAVTCIMKMVLRRALDLLFAQPPTPVIAPPTLNEHYAKALDAAMNDRYMSHINSTPRWDIQRWLIFGEQGSLGQIRKDLEAKISANLNGGLVRGPLMYVLPLETPAAYEGYPVIGAGFVRAATNEYAYGGAQDVVGRTVHRGLTELAAEYGETRIFGWSFKGGKEHINTRHLLAAFDQELAQKEFQNGGGSNPVYEYRGF
jgi:hypothetical protein